MHGTLRTVWRHASLVLKGMAYGLTHIVPGIGGGLILVVLGVYEQFVDAVGNLFVRRDRWREHLSFLVTLGAGMVLAMLFFSRVISTLAEQYPAETAFFFMGLLVGTVPGILRMHDDMHPGPGRLAALVVGMATVVGFRLLQHRFGLTEDPAASPTGGSLYIGATSFLAGGASVTPGLDGTYIWMLAGVYQRVLASIARLTELVIEWRILVPAGLGATAGILAFSKVIDAAFKRAPGLAHYAVLGLVAGSVYGLWPSVAPRTSLPVLVVGFAAGAGIALGLGRSPERANAAEAAVAAGSALAGDAAEDRTA